MRFTIAINDSALHSLIVPGGTVATVLSVSIESTMDLIRDARHAWRFDACSPPALFANRGVDDEHLPEFPFRDDTLLLWNAITKWVRAYLGVYYASDAAVQGDREVQAWVTELASASGAAVPGMDGLVRVADASWRVETLDYLVQLVSQIIYLAGPQHAAVNYAQYPLMAYLPAVSGALYRPPVTRSDEPTAQSLVDSLPPLDVALYQVSFAWLLSSVQYDVLGHYSNNPRQPYFADERVREAELDLVEALAAAEAVIRKRNKRRALPYVYQLPSMVPNSISI
jgi:arachidonate 15-lipoxygenase